MISQRNRNVVGDSSLSVYFNEDTFKYWIFFFVWILWMLTGTLFYNYVSKSVSKFPYTINNIRVSISIKQYLGFGGFFYPCCLIHHALIHFALQVGLLVSFMPSTSAMQLDGE